MRNRTTSLIAAALVAPILAACQPAEQGQMAGAAVDTAAIMATVDSVRQAYEDAYRAGDSAAIASMYATNAVYLPAMGPPVTGHSAVVGAITEGMGQMQEFSINSSGAKLLGADAVVDYGTVSTTVAAAEGDSTRSQVQGYLVVVQRTGSGWKLVRAVNTLHQAPGSAGN